MADTNRRGPKTTEFWVTIIAVVGVFGLLLTGKITVQQVVDLWPALGAVTGYAVSRGMAKSN